MSTYEICVTRTTVYYVEAEGSSRSAALRAAEALVKSGKIDAHAEEFSAGVHKRLGEPWVIGKGWEKGDVPVDDPTAPLRRPDRYMDSTDLLVFERAEGNVFTLSDVVLLKKRAEETIGVLVVDSWNGAGCGLLSIRMSKSFPLLTREQIDALLAPR